MSYGLDDENAFYSALEFWSALHGFVLLEMTGVMDDIDTDAVFTDMVLRLAAGMETPLTGPPSGGTRARFDLRHRVRVSWSLVPGQGACGCNSRRHACTPGQFACPL